MRRPSLALLATTLAAATIVTGATTADASSSPAATLSVVQGRITANTAPSFRVTLVHLPAGSTAYLQRQYGTGHVWKNVAGVRTSGTVAGARVPLGKYVYRVAVTRKGKSVVNSRSVNVLSYGTISLRALCGSLDGGNCDDGTEQVGTTIFSYVMESGNAGEYPNYENAAQLARTSCRSMTLRFASYSEDDSTVYLQVVQSSSDPQYGQGAPGAIGSFTAQLDGGPFYLNQSYSGGHYGAIFNGSASCWTVSGTY